MMYWDTGKNQGCRPRKRGTSPKWEGVGLSPTEQNRSQDNCAAWDLGWFQWHHCLQLSQVLSPSFLRGSYFWTFQHDTWCFSTLLCPQAAGWAFSSFYCQGAADTFLHLLPTCHSPHASPLAWRIPGMAEPGGLPSMGSHRVGHKWSDLAAAEAAILYLPLMWSSLPNSFTVTLLLQKNHSRPPYHQIQ